MATDDNLTAQLRAWGFAQANRFALTYADRSTHVLEQARDMAPGTRERALRDLVGRDGSSRRRFMADRSGVEGMGMLPAWAVDPVQSTNDAEKPHDNPEIAVDVGIPDELRWVEQGLASMMRQHPLPAARHGFAHRVHGVGQPGGEGTHGGGEVRRRAVRMAVPPGAAAGGRLDGRQDRRMNGESDVLSI